MSVNYSTFRSNALNFVHSIIIIMIFSCRVISHVVLIPFCDNDEDTEDTLAPSSRELADRNLQQCIKEAYKAAGVMVSVGKSLCTSQAQLHQVMDKIASSLEGNKGYGSGENETELDALYRALRGERESYSVCVLPVMTD